MDSHELSQMRLKQTAVTNGLLVLAILIFYVITSVFTITLTHYFLVLGVIMILQGVFGLLKRDSTKSLIPIYEKIAIYEKEKMGREWYKQRRVGHIWNLIFGSLLFLQSYWNRQSQESVFEMDLIFIFIMTLFLLLIVNMGMIFHYRKVDRSTNPLDLKGYTRKSNLLGLAIGLVVGFATIIITIFFIF